MSRKPDARAAARLGLLLLSACAAEGRSVAGPPAEALLLGAIETQATLALLEGTGADAGLPRTAWVELRLEPVEPLELTLVGERPAGRAAGIDLPAAQAQVEFEIRWADFEGTQPTSYGGSMRRVLPFGPDGTAARGLPLVRRFAFALPEPAEGILARRVSAWARLHPVDLRAAGRHSGGASISFARQGRLAVRHRPAGDLEAALADPAVPAADLFLLGVLPGVDDAPLEGRLETLVSVLPGQPRARREALAGALQCLTGEGHGSNVYRWQAWWAARQAGSARP